MFERSTLSAEGVHSSSPRSAPAVTSTATFLSPLGDSAADVAVELADQLAHEALGGFERRGVDPVGRVRLSVVLEPGQAVVRQPTNRDRGVAGEGRGKG